MARCCRTALGTLLMFFAQRTMVLSSAGRWRRPAERTIKCVNFLCVFAIRRVWTRI
jgi:hypothetical protein